MTEKSLMSPSMAKHVMLIEFPIFKRFGRVSSQFILWNLSKFS